LKSYIPSEAVHAYFMPTNVESELKSVIQHSGGKYVKFCEHFWRMRK